MKDILLDITVIILALIAASLALFLFISNLTKTVVRNDKKPVATVTFKYKTVQRKFLDRAVWDRPMQHSPVYNGDIIKTAPYGEAKLFFKDKNVVDIGSDTMIQIFVKDEEAEIGLTEGAVSVQTSGSKMKVNSNNATITVNEGSLLHADKKDAENLQLVVAQGEAEFAELTAGSHFDAESQPDIKTLTKNAVFQTGAEASLVMITPAPNMKVLNQNEEGSSLPILFKWYSSFPADEELILQTSTAGDFSQNKQSFSVTGLNEITIEQKSGPVYWRIYPAKRGEKSEGTVSGKLTLLSAPAPVPLLPAKNGSYFYKKTLPSVRFLWKGNDMAASYLIEVADNPQMQNPKISRFINMESLTASDFTAGTWYWRITPRYLTSADNTAVPSEIASFIVEQKQVLPEPESLFPQEIADTANAKNLTFAWKPVSEAKQYRIIISDNKNMNNVIVDEIISGNYFEVKNAAALLPNGEYYWTVAGLDDTGAALTESNIKSFKTLDADAMLRSIFPPDEYILADTLCRDTRFTWKTNIAGEQNFQISNSSDFSHLLVDAKTANSGFDGVALKEGTYYWRVITNVGDTEIKTETKKLIVAPPLPKPKLIDIDKRVIIMPNEPNTFKWTPAVGADYYQIKISKQGLEETPLYENLFITDTEVELDLQHITDGSYVVSIQGFATATLTSSRRYGLAEDSEIVFRHLMPAELKLPENNARIDGIKAILEPSVLKWSSVESIANSTVTLEKSGEKKPVFIAHNSGFTVQLPPLEAGKYTWRVTAESTEGLDVSSREDFNFSVLPIPPLPAVQFISPEKNAVLNASFFKNNRAITFSWNKIDDATEYSIIIYNENKRNKPLFTAHIPLEKEKETPVIEFKELSLLSRGTFFVEVKAMRKLKDGKLLQDGIVSKLKFEIDLPIKTKIETNETGVLYGK